LSLLRDDGVKDFSPMIVMCLEELQEENKPINLRFPEVIGIKQVEVTV
jgi:hypothetical protein